MKIDLFKIKFKKQISQIEKCIDNIRSLGEEIDETEIGDLIEELTNNISAFITEGESWSPDTMTSINEIYEALDNYNEEENLDEEY